MSRLRRVTPIRRAQILKAAADHHSRRLGLTRNTGASTILRQQVHDRDSSCIRCGQDDTNTWPPSQLHHRRPRAMGGTTRIDTNSPSNLILVCDACHRWIETHRTEAHLAGWLIPQAADPAHAPLTWHGQQVLLQPDGTVTEP